MQDRWSEVKQLLADALEHTAKDRAAFLDRACDNDPRLREEVESLLAQAATGGEFMVSSAVPRQLSPARFLDLPPAPSDGVEYAPMDPRLRRVEQIFNAAAELPEDMRAAWLDLACAGDKDLRREVESLLSHDETSDPLGEQPLQQIGSYRIVREIGSGGMGVLYEAVRENQFQKRVALKVVKRGMDTTSIMRRFYRERQILAGLSHPNITSLLDGGATPDGRPYFVIEYVEGKPIDEYCDARKLTTPQRLELFRAVCGAVQYAHQNLVVHRDLKPGNILVTNEGVPKLLDFGIAKILNVGVTAGTIDMTVAAMRVMTAEYASPEQVRGEAITTSTDIYSLGVVLYELLTGHRPYHFKTRTPQEIAQVICEREPEKPSTAITRVQEAAGTGSGHQKLTPEGVSGTRDGQPGQLRKRLRGDVDNIVLKALHKDPKGRYPSVEQFSEDIRRHLTRMPVMARKVTAAYRIRKFVLRHKSGVFAAGAVVLVLIAGMVGIIREARIADTQGARAERRFQDVRTLANSLLFELHDAIQNLPGATAAREVLVKRALQYLDSLSRESASDPTLRGELAEAYEKVGDVQGGYRASNLGDQAGAIASYRKALAIRESLATAAPGDFGLVRSIVRSTGKLSDLLLQTGNQAEALEHSLKLLPMAERLARHDPGNVEDQRNLASAYIDLGWKQAETGDWKAGLPNLRRAVLLFEGLAAAHPDDVVIQRRLAIAYERTGQIITANTESYGEALALHQKQVALAEQLSTAAPLNTDLRRIAAYAHVDLGENLMLTGDPAAAAPHYAKASAAFQSLSAADPRNVQYRVDAAMGLGVEANSAIETGHAARAIERLKQSLAILAEFPSAADSRELAVVNQFRMGKAYGRLGRWREACPWFERSLTGLVEAQQRGRLSGHDLDMIGEAREALRKCAGAELDH